MVDGVATQPPIPIESCVAKASAAALIVREQKQLRGMEDRRGKRDVRIHFSVVLDSSERKLSLLSIIIRVPTTNPSVSFNRDIGW